MSEHTQQCGCGSSKQENGNNEAENKGELIVNNKAELQNNSIYKPADKKTVHLKEKYKIVDNHEEIKDEKQKNIDKKTLKPKESNSKKYKIGDQDQSQKIVMLTSTEESKTISTTSKKKNKPLKKDFEDYPVEKYNKPIQKDLEVFPPKESKVSFKKIPSEYKEDKEISDQNISKETNAKSTKGKYYYTNRETSLLGDFKKLFKIKRKKNKSKCCASKNIEKIPSSECKIKVEAWEKHDENKCPIEYKDYKYVGELLFPVCSKDIFQKEPGVLIRKSQKSYTLNDPNKFGPPILEDRKYAYPEKVIPGNLGSYKMTQDETQELIEWVESCKLNPKCQNLCS